MACVEYFHFNELANAIAVEFPIVVRPLRKVFHGRKVPQEFRDAFGPLATDWHIDNMGGFFHDDRRWDYLSGYRFRTEADAVLFKFMVGV